MSTHEIAKSYVVRYTPLERAVLGIFGVLIVSGLGFIGHELVNVRDSVKLLVAKYEITVGVIADYESRIRSLESKR